MVRIRKSLTQAAVIGSLLVFASFVSAVEAFGQSVSISGGTATLGDADEYFTDQMADAKDFNSTCDAGFDLWAYAPESSANGIWSGTHPQMNAPILGIAPIPTTGTNLAVYREDCWKLSMHKNPVDTTKYTQVSWKMRNSYPSSFGFYWSYDPAAYAVNGFAQYDGYFLTGGGVATPANSWVIHNFSLPSVAPAATPWSSAVYGLSLWPSMGQPAGGTTSMDWVRLIDPTTSPTVNLSWTYNRGSRPDSQYDQAVLYVDTDNSGFDGIAVARSLPRSGSTAFRTGILAPGRYYFYVQIETSNGVTPSLVTRSGYAGPYTINGKPTLEFSAPGRMSGPEYARDELGDPWDMNQATDVANLVDQYGNPTPSVMRGLHDWSFQNGYFYATSDEDPIGFTVDTQMYMRTAPGRPVDTNYYRYFCYSMQVDPMYLARNGDPALLNDAGWVGRFVWQRTRVAGAFGTTAAHELVESSVNYPDYQNGFSTYCFDLWDDRGHEHGAKWRDVNYVDVLRFDPMEARHATNFIFDWGALYAENRSVNGNYTIQWQAQDPENDNLSVALYYDTDRAGFNGTHIATLNGQAAGQGSYNWNVAGVAPGTYYIYAVVTDSRNTNRFYSDVYVHVNAPEARGPALTQRTPCDFDGDNKTDFRVVRGGANGNASFYTRRSSDGQIALNVTGNTMFDTFVDADTDGDRVGDIGFIRSLVYASLYWYYTSSLTAQTGYWQWGLLGDVPSIADIDGDGIDDITIFRPADGTWWSIRSTLGAIGLWWGLPGDIPVPEDYDGDGWDDIAVWRPSIGYWAVLQSSHGASMALEDIIWLQWGLPGDHPMPGDYDGDGKADLMVFRPSWGLWLMCPSSNGFNCAQGMTIQQFGLPGDYPIKGDFDGDDILDLSVWRPSNGTWYYKRSSDGGIVMQQWGLPGDMPLCAGPLDRMQHVQTKTIRR